jgi:excisionase family DNA binding protein
MSYAATVNKSPSPLTYYKMNVSPTPPRLYLDITEAMYPALEQMAEMMAEKTIAQYLEANPPSGTPVPELLTKQEAADLLKMTVATVDKLRKSGHIKAVFIGAAVRIPSTEITKYLIGQ